MGVPLGGFTGFGSFAAGRGVKFLYGATARGLVTEADRVVAVLREEELEVWDLELRDMLDAA